MGHHNSLINFKEEIKLAQEEFFINPSETITKRIIKANKTLQKAVKGSDAQFLNNDELTKNNLKKLNLMITDQIWLKKK